MKCETTHTKKISDESESWKIQKKRKKFELMIDGEMWGKLCTSSERYCEA